MLEREEWLVLLWEGKCGEGKVCGLMFGGLEVWVRLRVEGKDEELL